MSTDRDIITHAVGVISASTTDDAARQSIARVGLAMRAERARAKDPRAWDRVTPQSVIAVMEWCARYGLPPGASPPVCYIIPQGGSVQARITHIGYATLLARVGIRLRTVPVAMADEIEVDCGTVTRHRPASIHAEPASLTDLAGVIVCVSGRGYPAELRLWVPRSVVETAMRASQSRGGPWQTHPIPMARAAAIRAAFRRGDIIAEGFDLADDIVPEQVTATVTGPGARLAAAEQRLLSAPVDAPAWPDAVEAEAVEAEGAAGAR